MDREKVIEEAEAFIKRLAPDDKHKRHIGIMVNLGWIYDVLALLKEQEAVEPILIHEGRNKHYNDYVCPRCDNEVVYKQNYCSECGTQFLWEGR